MDRILGSDCPRYPQLSSETKSSLYTCMIVTHLTYGCQTWTLSSPMIDGLEVAHNCFLRQLKGIQFSPDRTISTAEQRASFVGKMIRTSHPLSDPVSAAFHMRSRPGFQPLQVGIIMSFWDNVHALFDTNRFKSIASSLA
eukprot:341405-Chlamydomonas_euryale.AAC.2